MSQTKAGWGTWILLKNTGDAVACRSCEQDHRFSKKNAHLHLLKMQGAWLCVCDRRSSVQICIRVCLSGTPGVLPFFGSISRLWRTWLKFLNTKCQSKRTFFHSRCADREMPWCDKTIISCVLRKYLLSLPVKTENHLFFWCDLRASALWETTFLFVCFIDTQTSQEKK